MRYDHSSTSGDRAVSIEIGSATARVLATTSPAERFADRAPAVRAAISLAELFAGRAPAVRARRSSTGA